MKTNRTLRLMMVLVLALVVAAVASACAAPTPTPAPTALPPTAAPKASIAPTQAPTTAASTQAPATAAPKATAAPTSAPTAASVQPDLDFYKGKMVTYIVATKPGGGYDTYARTIAPFLQKYLPGSTVVIKNVDGAGHIIGTNELYGSKADGLTIGTFNTALVYGQIVGQEGIRFDLTKMTWISKLSNDNRVMIVGSKTPYKTFEDALKASQTNALKMATNGPTSAAQVDALLLQESTGLKVRPIPGYQGKDGDLAVIRGEVDGEVGTYGSLKPLVDSGDARVLLQMGQSKDPGLPDIPLITDIVKADKKNIASLMIANAALGRLNAAPPEVPAARRAALIQAFQKAVADPEFQATAKKADLLIDAAYGDDVTNLIKASLTHPADELKLLKEILGPSTGN